VAGLSADRAASRADSTSARRFGVDAGQLRAAPRMSSAASHALGNWGNQTMAWAEDDMRIVRDLAAEVGIALPQGALNREL
jgi:3-hydroxyisobutyrate dehydrogenase